MFWLRDPRIDALERRARQLSGWSAVDCGSSVATDYVDQTEGYVDQKSLDDRAAGNACATAAFSAHRAFRVRFETSGPGAAFSEIVVGTAQGHLYRLSQGSGLADQPYKEEACVSLPCR